MSELENKINHLLEKLHGIEDLKNRKKIEVEILESGELFSILREVTRVILDKKIQEKKFKNVFSSFSLLDLKEGVLSEEELNSLGIQIIEYCETIESEEVIGRDENVVPLILFFLWPRWDSFKFKLFGLIKNQEELIQNYGNFVDRANKTIRDYFDPDYLSKENALGFHLTQMIEKISDTKTLVPESDINFQNLHTHYLQVARDLWNGMQIIEWVDFLSLGYDSRLIELLSSIKGHDGALSIVKIFLEKVTVDPKRELSSDLLNQIEKILSWESDTETRLEYSILLTELIIRNNSNNPSELKSMIKNVSDFKSEISTLKYWPKRNRIREILIDSLIRTSAYEECLHVILEIEEALSDIPKVLTLVLKIVKEKDPIHVFEKIKFNKFLEQLKEKVDAIRSGFHNPEIKNDFLYVQSFFLRDKNEWDSHFQNYPAENLVEKLKHQISVLSYVFQNDDELVSVLNEILKDRTILAIKFTSYPDSNEHEVLNPIFHLLEERNLILNDKLFPILEWFCKEFNHSFSVYFACRFSKLYSDKKKGDKTNILLTLAGDKINSTQEPEPKIDSCLYFLQTIETYSMKPYQNQIVDLVLKTGATLRSCEFQKLYDWVVQFHKLGIISVVQMFLEIKSKILFLKTYLKSPVTVWGEIANQIDRVDSPDSRIQFLEASFSFYIDWEGDFDDDISPKLASITKELFQLKPALGKSYLNRTLAHMSENDFQYSETLELIGKIIYDNQLIQDYVSLLDNFCTDELSLETMISVSLVLGEAMIHAGMIEEAFQNLKEEKIKEYNSEFNYSYHEKEWYEGKRFHLFDMMGKKEEGINFVKSIEYDYSDEQVNESIELYQKWIENEEKNSGSQKISSKAPFDLSKDLMDLKKCLNQNSKDLENAMLKCLTFIALSGFPNECRTILEKEWKKL